MKKPTKKDLKAALSPYRKSVEHWALDVMAGRKTAKPTDIEWQGIKIDCQLVRRSTVVCNVPAPYSTLEIWYSAKRGGVAIAHGQGSAEMADALIWWLRTEMSAKAA